MKIFRIIYSLYAYVVFVILMLLLYPLIALATVSKTKALQSIHHLLKLWAKIWYLLIGIQHEEKFIEPHDLQQQCIYVCNHISYMDIPAILLSIKGSFKVLGKIEIAKIPLFGWIYSKVVVLIDRTTNQKKASSYRMVNKTLSDGVSMLFFPEGTFNETGHPLKDFYDGAFKIAIENQLPIQPLLLIDTHQRLHFSSVLSLSPGRSKVVYLAPISTKGTNLQQISELKQSVYKKMETTLMAERNNQKSQEKYL